MKKMFLLAALMTAAIISAEEVVVYENPFVTETSTQLNGVQQGTPAVLWTTTQDYWASTNPAIPATGANFLQIQNKKATGAQGRNILTAPIANFKSPFTAKLHDITADSVVWTFNFRNNNQYAMKGFDTTKLGNAIILVSDREDLLHANGYAVTMGDDGTPTKTIKLSYFTDGLGGNSHITSILSTPQVTLKKYWHIRVVYIPNTDTWKLGFEEKSAFALPDTCVWTDCGSVVNNIYTSTPMSHFGFLNKYSGNNDAIMYIKNYKIMAYGYEPTPTPDPEPEYEPQTLAMPNMDIYTGSFTAQNATELADMRYGTPKVLWTNTKYTYGTAAECVTPSMQAELNVPGLKAADSKGRNILTAPTALFGMPWESKLSECAADSIVWMFNMRYNYDWTNGFNEGQRGIAAVLAMDGADMLTANGYAIVNNATYYYKLVRFDGGLNDNDKVTELCSTVKIQQLSDSTKFTNKRYMTFRVIYVPSTNTWKMYYAGNTSSGAYQKPDESTIWNLADSVVDATHTSKEMTYFGFMNNYLQGASFDASLYIKNYSIGAFTSGVTSISLDEGKHNGHMLEALDGETVDVRMERVLHGGSWNTLCVPFDMSSEEIAGAWGEGVELAIFSGAVMESGALVLEFDDTVTAIEAGKPYLIKPGADVTGATVLSNRVISKSAETINAAPVKMTGVLSPTVLKAGANTLYLGANNTLYQVEAGSDPLPGMRAYFTLNDEVAGAPAFRLRVGNHGTPTGMDNVERDNAQCTKVIRDGHIVIIREGKEYSIVGQ